MSTKAGVKQEAYPPRELKNGNGKRKPALILTFSPGGQGNRGSRVWPI